MTISNSVVEIDLASLRRNIETLKQASRPAKMVGVVKANAYGHGVKIVATELLAAGVERLAVATVGEGIELREEGFKVPILVMAAPMVEHLELYHRHELDLTISSGNTAEFVYDWTRSKNSRLQCHVKIDTGMGRIGCKADEAHEVLTKLTTNPLTPVQSVWTHLARSTEDDGKYSGKQIDRFADAIGSGPGPDGLVQHAASSYALGTSRKSVDLPSEEKWTRIGVALYGMMDQRKMVRQLDLEPILRWTSQLVHIKSVETGTPISYGGRWVASRPTLIGTVSAGYADGYSRRLSNRSEVGIGGDRFPVVGTICMDMFMVDLGAPETQDRFDIGDEVVLMGSGGPSVFDLADWAETISYEITTSITSRVGRRTR